MNKIVARLKRKESWAQVERKFYKLSRPIRAKNRWGNTISVQAVCVMCFRDTGECRIYPASISHRAVRGFQIRGFWAKIFGKIFYSECDALAAIGIEMEENRD